MASFAGFGALVSHDFLKSQVFSPNNYFYQTSHQTWKVNTQVRVHVCCNSNHHNHVVILLQLNCQKIDKSSFRAIYRVKRSATRSPIKVWAVLGSFCRQHTKVAKKVFQQFINKYTHQKTHFHPPNDLTFILSTVLPETRDETLCFLHRVLNKPYRKQQVHCL